MIDLVGCVVCGAASLGECDRCGRAVCAPHKILSEPGPYNPGRAETFCPDCWRKRGAMRKAPDLVDAAKFLWNAAIVLLFAVALLYAVISGLYSWIVGS